MKPLTQLKRSTAPLLVPLVLACFALARPLAAGTRDGGLDFSNTPVGVGIITFDAPGAGTDPMQGTLAFAINQAGTIRGTLLYCEFCHPRLRARYGRRHNSVRCSGWRHRSRPRHPTVLQQQYGRDYRVLC